MICPKCGTEHEKKRCPTCTQKNIGEFFVAAIKAALYAVMFMGIQIAVQFVFLVVRMISLLVGGLDPLDLTQVLLSDLYANVCKMTILSSLLTILAIGILHAVRHKPAWEALRLKRTGSKPLVIAAVFGAALQIVINITVEMIPWPDAWMDAFLEMSDMIVSESLLAQFLAVVILGPIAEELVFRGLIHIRFKRVVSPVVAAVLSGAVFGIIHGNVVQFCYTSVLGVILALVMDRYDSILPCIVIHIVFNGVTFLPLYNLSAAGITVLYITAVGVSLLCAYLIWFAKDARKKESIPAIPKEGKDIENEDL